MTLDQPEEVGAVAEIDENWWFAFGDEPTVRRVVKHLQLMEETYPYCPIIVWRHTA